MYSGGPPALSKILSAIPSLLVRNFDVNNEPRYAADAHRAPLDHFANTTPHKSYPRERIYELPSDQCPDFLRTQKEGITIPRMESAMFMISEPNSADYLPRRPECSSTASTRHSTSTTLQKRLQKRRVRARPQSTSGERYAPRPSLRVDDPAKYGAPSERVFLVL